MALKLYSALFLALAFAAPALAQVSFSAGALQNTPICATAPTALLPIFVYDSAADNYCPADTINEAENDVDLCIDGTSANLFCTDAGSSRIGINTPTPAVALDVVGDIAVGGSNNELRFYEGANYVGLEAPALSGDQIWVLPAADGVDGDLLCTNGSGVMGWASGAFEKALSFGSPSGSSGTFYFGGYYDYAGAANDFNPSVNFGTANSSYAAHFFAVCAAGGAGGTDTVIRVSGTSIDDSATRTGSDTEDITIDDAGAAGAYYEGKKWIGQIAIVKVSGPDLLCNYGLAKYWDNSNSDFRVTGLEVSWVGGANDAGPNVILRHHRASGWTYNAGAAPSPPAGIASLQGDHVTEYQVVNGEPGAWKRTDLNTTVDGDDSEGTIWEVVTTANKTFELGNILMRIIPATTP